MQEIRCKKCKRLLMKGEIKRIEIKCPKCGYLQLIKWDPEDTDKDKKGEEVRHQR